VVFRKKVDFFTLRQAQSVPREDDDERKGDVEECVGVTVWIADCGDGGNGSNNT